MEQAYLYDAVRTPFGKYGGQLSSVRPDDLGAFVIEQILLRNQDLDPADLGEVYFGNANGAGEENRNVARMSSLLAGVPDSVPGTTINRLCGSSLDATIQASRALACGDMDLVLVGGVESMSRAPWVLPKTEKPYPAGNMTLESTALGWRLVNPAMKPEWTLSLGESTEQLAEKYSIDRERMDRFAERSHRLTAQAWESGFYDDLVEQIPGTDLVRDEPLRPSTTIEALADLKPVFRKDGTGRVTAGNASPLSDGASALLLGSSRAHDILGRDPLVRLAGRGVAAGEPRYFGFAPVEAANRALAAAGLTWDKVGAVELNEAFAAQALACIDGWGIEEDIVNRKGGAIAIGHPLGASGGRLVATLAKTMREEKIRYGVAALCIGVGQGLALVLENEDAPA
ncbi:thiolase family protein [Rothia nasimurium]|uniref:thiolase family protein n=1 Tax=Rothia nasimurium TaxID=85336 RepID=UPI003BA25D54